MLRLAFDFIITWRETRTRPNAYTAPSPQLPVNASIARFFNSEFVFIRIYFSISLKLSPNYVYQVHHHTE